MAEVFPIQTGSDLHNALSLFKSAPKAQSPKRFLASKSQHSQRLRSLANLSKKSFLWHRWVMCPT